MINRTSVITVLATCALAASARATVLIPADLAELSRDARTIARGRVIAVDGVFTDDRGSIETLVTLEVESYLKGALGATLQFRVPGGNLGRFRSVVVGAPEFDVDDRVVVFLGARGPTIPFLLGLSQGVYRIVRAADSSEWLVTPPPVIPSTTGTAAIVRGDTSRRPMAIAQFEQRVRALAGTAP